MNIPTLTIRKFRADDALMLQFCATTHDHLSTNLAAFTAFDAQFDADYLTAFDAAIDAARNYPTDDQLIDVQAQLTLDVEAKMTECRNFFQAFKYWIEKAFPNSPGRWNEFGYNDYGRVNRDHEKMIQFMTNLAATTTKYLPQLGAAGYIPPLPMPVTVLNNALQALNTQQELSKGARTSGTEQRITLLNAAYDMCYQVCWAGKLIYANDYGHFQLFVFPWAGGTSPNPAIEGTVLAGEVINIPVPALEGTTVLDLINLGIFELHFYFSATAGAPTGTPPVVISAGADVDTEAVNLGWSALNPWLNVTLPAGISCDYKVLYT